MSKTARLLLYVTAVILCTAPAHTATLTFEDLQPDCDAHPAPYTDIYGLQTAYGYAIPNGYVGLMWDHFSVVDAPAHAAYFHEASCGELNALVSGAVVAYNSYAMPATMESAMPIALHSAYLTAIWHDGLTVSVDGYLGGDLRYSKSVNVRYYQPTLVTFEFSNVDKVVWSSSLNGVSGDGNQFAMDDLSYDYVPEPASLATLICGIGAAGGLARRRPARGR